MRFDEIDRTDEGKYRGCCSFVIHDGQTYPLPNAEMGGLNGGISRAVCVLSSQILDGVHIYNYFRSTGH